MDRKVKFGHLTINLDTCPTTKSEFKKRYGSRIRDIDKAWDEISRLNKGKRKKETKGDK